MYAQAHAEHWTQEQAYNQEEGLHED